MIPLNRYLISASGVTTRGGWTVSITVEYEATSATEAAQWVFEELTASITVQRLNIMIATD